MYLVHFVRNFLFTPVAYLPLLRKFLQNWQSILPGKSGELRILVTRELTKHYSWPLNSVGVRSATPQPALPTPVENLHPALQFTFVSTVCICVFSQPQLVVWYVAEQCLMKKIHVQVDPCSSNPCRSRVSCILSQVCRLVHGQLLKIYFARGLNRQRVWMHIKYFM